ncbi:hypothetical protein JCM18899A_14030 [Nocardioides sp. AN3]
MDHDDDTARVSDASAADDEWERAGQDESGYVGADEEGYADILDSTDGISRPVNWNLLDAEEAEVEWRDLDRWVTWLKTTFGLPPAIVPPYWHRHDELIWELSALHTHFLNSYHPDTSPSAPIGWLRDFAEARHRLRDWVAACGTRLDRDRPTRQTPWPGETTGTEADAASISDPQATARGEVEIRDRAADFEVFVQQDLFRRRRTADLVATQLRQAESDGAAHGN